MTLPMWSACTPLQGVGTAVGKVMFSAPVARWLKNAMGVCRAGPVLKFLEDVVDYMIVNLLHAGFVGPSSCRLLNDHGTRLRRGRR